MPNVFVGVYSSLREKENHIHRQEHHVGFSDALLDFGGKEKVLSTHLLHDLVQTGLVDGKRLAVPLLHSLFVQIDDIDFDIGALEGNNRHGGSADIASADAANVLDPIRHAVQNANTAS